MLIAYPFASRRRWRPTRRRWLRPCRPASTFRFDDNAPGRDTVHWADGTGALIPTRARAGCCAWTANFKAGPGPNFWIYLNTRGVGDEGDFMPMPSAYGSPS